MSAIEQADCEQRQIALELVLSRDGADRPQSVQFFAELMQRGELDPSGLLIAHHDSQLAGAILCQAMPGNMGALWPPRLTPAVSDAYALELLSAALRWFDEQGVMLVQSLLRIGDYDGQHALEAAGFTRAADLLYLAWLTAEQTIESPRSDELAFLPYSEQLYPRLAAVMQHTYEQTLDCPALNGRRNIDEVISGYRATGEFAPDRWLLVQHDQSDVGCLLLTDHPRTNQWELMYMGLIPPARGKGWGKELVRQAQRLTAAAKRQALSVAVDTQNLPALRVYRDCGFFVFDSRRVLLYEMPGAGH